jgi:hypothetical protein
MATNTTVSTAQTTTPAILEPYFTGVGQTGDGVAGGLLPAAQKLFSQSYQQRYGDVLDQSGLAGAGRIAGLSPNEVAAGQQISDLRQPTQFRQGQSAYQTGLGSLDAAKAGYQGGSNVSAPNLTQFQMAGPQTVNAPQGLSSFDIAGAGNVNAQNLNQYQMAGPQQYLGQNVSQYMSPYQQNVVDVQKAEAMRDAQKQLVGANLGSSRQGTYGGARNALMQSEAQRNLQTQMGNIQATGSQNAFQNAQNQFNAQNQLQQSANAQNLQAQLGVQQLGSGQNLQAQLANQQAQQQAQLANQQARLGVQQFGAGQNMQAMLANQAAQQATGQTNLQAQLGIQQLGAGQSLEAQRANQAAQLQRAAGLGQLGQTYGAMGQGLGQQGALQQQADIARAAALGAYGGSERGVAQQQLDAQYQDVMRGAGFAEQQLGSMSNILRGVPLGDTYGTQTTTAAPPSFASQLAGIGLGGLSLANMIK